MRVFHFFHFRMVANGDAEALRHGDEMSNGFVGPEPVFIWGVLAPQPPTHTSLPPSLPHARDSFPLQIDGFASVREQLGAR